MNREKTVGTVLRDIRRELDFIDSCCLLAFVLGRDKEFLLTHPERTMSRRETGRLRRYVKRRLNGEPVASITGVREFYSLVFFLSRHTLIPRPETEMLVEEIIRLRPSTLLDIGTGSGCIAVSAARFLPSCRVTASDVSSGALRTARRNAARLLEHGTVSFVKSSYFDGIPPADFDIIVSNPPYIRRGDLGDRASFEPVRALDGGIDGLDGYRAIISGARKYLKSGMVLLEISPELRKGVEELARTQGFDITIRKDLAGLDRMAVLR